MQGLFDSLMIVLFYLLRVFPIKKNKIVISSYLGKGYGDNPKYIVEKLLERNQQYDIVWLAKNINGSFPKEVRVVNYKSLRSIYELCTAKIWIDNRRKPPYVRKRKNQCYIMTWHGYMAIKKVEKDAEHCLEARYIDMAKQDSKMIDYFISGSKWETKCISTAFWYDGKILNIGYPRSDILLRDNEKIRSKVKKKYGINTKDKILLYAPTFRRCKDEKSLLAYSIDWNDILQSLQSKFDGNWVGMFRLHPNISSWMGRLNIPDKVFNVTSYDDMQELIVSCDCMITDYSSSIIDAGVAGKIGFIYASDYAEYKKDRDVYFDIKEDIPFLFSETNKQLIENIRCFDLDKYQRNLEYFLKEIYGIFDSGEASIKVCEVIDKVTSRG